MMNKKENNLPLVTIIITTYKRHNYLENAILSCINQTYKNIEIIIVDDNDCDSEYSLSVEHLIREKFKENTNIRLLKMIKNSGACKARNRGLKEAKGEFVNFLDDDDIFYENKIELQMKIYEKDFEKKYAVVGCFAFVTNGKEKLLQVDKNEVRGDVFFDCLCHSICQTSLPLIRKEYLLKSGGFEEIVACQEHLMLVNLLSKYPMYDYSPNYLVEIHHHEKNRISSSINRPIGAIELYKRISSRYLNSFTKEQSNAIELALKKNIINSWLLYGDKKNAYKWYKKIGTLKFRQRFKILLDIILGIKIKIFIISILARKKYNVVYKNEKR